MRLSYREKQIFFTQLAQLLRAGKALPGAAETLARSANTRIRAAARRLRRLLEEGLTAGEAFDALRPTFGALERSTLSALARSGRLEVGLNRLADYFGVLARARTTIATQSVYPLVLLHLGIVAANVPLLVSPGGMPAFVRAMVFALVIFYGALLLLALFVPALDRSGARDASLDAALRRMPLIGKARRALAVSRFCGTLDIQLDAGVNVIESLQVAARASQSGLLYRLAQRGIERLRDGQSLADALSGGRGALPADAIDAIMVAEQSGDLHRALPRLQAEYEEEGLRRLRSAAAWMPKILYSVVVIYLGYSAISAYLGYLKAASSILDNI